MALMKAALAWERFVLKDVTRFAALAKVGHDNIAAMQSSLTVMSCIVLQFTSLHMFLLYYILSFIALHYNAVYYMELF